MITLHHLKFEERGKAFRCRGLVWPAVKAIYSVLPFVRHTRTLCTCQISVHALRMSHLALPETLHVGVAHVAQAPQLQTSIGTA